MPHYRNRGEGFMPFVAIASLVIALFFVMVSLNAGEGGTRGSLVRGLTPWVVLAVGLLIGAAVLILIGDTANKGSESGRRHRHGRGHRHRHRTRLPDAAIKPAPADEGAERGQTGRDGITCQEPGGDAVRLPNTSYPG
jgi:hypothetical protein